MDESVIKEIKSIYASKIRNTDPTAVKADIKAIKSEIKGSKSFFNGVIEKLNIIVSKDWYVSDLMTASVTTAAIIVVARIFE